MQIGKNRRIKPPIGRLFRFWLRRIGKITSD
jgi:hypothetical protein